MFLDSSVTVIKDDGSRVLTTTVEPGDNIVGTTYEELLARYGVQESSIVRTDADLSAAERVPTVPLPPEEGTVVPSNTPRPEGDANKGQWWQYVKSLGYSESEYDGVTKAGLVAWADEHA